MHYMSDYRSLRTYLISTPHYSTLSMVILDIVLFTTQKAQYQLGTNKESDPTISPFVIVKMRKTRAHSAGSKEADERKPTID